MTLTQDDVVNFLETEGVDIEEDNITNDSALFSSNLLDSFKMVALIMLVEKKCGIRVGPAELTLENFDSISSIIRFTESKRPT